jgi:hypothetical protein
LRRIESHWVPKKRLVLSLQPAPVLRGGNNAEMSVRTHFCGRWAVR